MFAGRSGLTRRAVVSRYGANAPSVPSYRRE